MAIRIMLDHGVLEENIIFIALISTPQGVHNIFQAFPKVRLIISEIDDGLSSEFYILPGAGNLGDIYFGTENKKL